MTSSSNEWNLDGFIEHFDFVHHKMLDHKFAWVLGAGASYASGIPLGSELVDRWLKELYVREVSGNLTLEEWATDKNLDIVGFKFDQRASFYPKIYARRFRDYPEEGYAYLESVMSGKDPSPGYSILASVLAQDPPRHNVVITTNFDNLVADALSIYTDTFPFVAGHESLTGFVRVAMRRPLICKIHRDLLLGPQNDPRSLRRLHDAWGTALRGLFQHYTPLFVGYGGNDDTLMDLLESLQPADIKGELIWCYYETSSPSERIRNVVADLKGILVPVPDFDLLMILLGERMKINLLDEEIGTRAEARTVRYRNRIQRLDTVSHPKVTAALAATLDRSGGWWVWEQKANLEKDPKRKEVVYKQAIKHCPRSMELYANFAIFQWEVLSNYDEADQLFRGAINLAPKDVQSYANYAEFLMTCDRLTDAAKVLAQAQSLNKGETNEIALIISLLSILLGLLENNDVSGQVIEFSALLDQSDRPEWKFEEISKLAKKQLSKRNNTLLNKLIEQLQGNSKEDPDQSPIKSTRALSLRQRRSSPKRVRNRPRSALRKR